jgi:hydroxymethylpyrimidine pyrophosphatase-like HAD family hydrolase
LKAIAKKRIHINQTIVVGDGANDFANAQFSWFRDCLSR